MSGVRGVPTALPRTGRRTAGFQESVIREMTRLGDEAGAVNLSQGLPDFTPPPEVVAAAVAAIEGGDNQYTFPFGSPAFRSAIAERAARDQRIAADPETDVTVTCGVSEGMMSAIMALTDPGDEVLILEPWYENYVPDCVMAGVHPVFVPLRAPGYEVDGDALAAHLSPRTRLAVLNSPHNPTGRVFTRQELEILAALCVERNIIAVTDEIYEHILYDGREHVSIASLPGMAERTVTISGLGKTYAVTGWRVGWIIAAPRLSEEIRKVHDYLTICAPAPFQAAGTVALGLPAGYYIEMRRQYAQRRDLLLAGLTAAGFAYRQPEGAYYVMADFSGIRWDEDRWARPEWSTDRAFAEYLAREVGVAVVPGSSFYAGTSGGRSAVRFNFAKHLATLEAAVQRLRILQPR
ncbi:MAG TPA: aminotransferase class I/II-fold pyridoxal phosphate-dependent enzyme [bacterium]